METPIEAPPIIVEPKPPRKGLLGALVVLGLLLLNFGKLFLVSLKFLKLGAILQTGGSMLITAWFYSVALGWPFAVGFVVTILVHEIGHVVAAWAYGVPVSAPMFIPGMGAFIALKTPAPTVYAEAVIAIAGPIAGSLAGIVCWLVFSVTGSPLFLGLAHVTFMMNLFNLTPVFPLDGGRVLGAVSKWFMIPGMLILGTLFFTGVIRNPLILIIILMSLPHIFMSFKGGKLFESDVQVTLSQKFIIGVSYVALAGALAWAMAHTDSYVRPQKVSPQMVMSAPLTGPTLYS